MVVQPSKEIGQGHDKAGAQQACQQPSVRGHGDILGAPRPKRYQRQDHASRVKSKQAQCSAPRDIQLSRQMHPRQRYKSFSLRRLNRSFRRDPAADGHRIFVNLCAIHQTNCSAYGDDVSPNSAEHGYVSTECYDFAVQISLHNDATAKTIDRAVFYGAFDRHSAKIRISLLRGCRGPAEDHRENAQKHNSRQEANASRRVVCIKFPLN
jgi:hypothetical protein